MRSSPLMMNGNFWIVVMTILVPSTRAWASCCESSSIAFTTPWACSIWYTASCSWRSRTRRSVMTTTQVEDLLVGGGVQAREAVREPRDAVRLATARRVLDQVVAPRPVVTRCGDQPVDGVELVVAREDHRLALLGARALRVLDLLLARLEEDVGAEDVEGSARVRAPRPRSIRCGSRWGSPGCLSRSGRRRGCSRG